MAKTRLWWLAVYATNEEEKERVNRILDRNDIDADTEWVEDEEVEEDEIEP